MGNLWLAPLVLAVAATVVAAAASAPGGRVSVNDAAGDNKTAPDVTSLELRQEGARVVYEFAITGRPNKLEEGEYLVFFVDSDNNPKTGGNKAGADYLMEFEQKGKGLLRVNKYDPAKKEFLYDGTFTRSFRKQWGGLNAPTRSGGSTSRRRCSGSRASSASTAARRAPAKATTTPSTVCQTRAEDRSSRS
jgi:hypothetical protein